MSLRRAARLAGIPLTIVAFVIVARTLRAQDLTDIWSALTGDPAGLLVAAGAYSAAFALRAGVWRALVPLLSFWHAWSAIHLSLAANHLLPLRLGETVRPASASRRGGVSLASATATTVAMRSADVLAVAGLAAVLAPALIARAAGPWAPALLGAVVVAGGGAAWWIATRIGGTVRLRTGLVLPAALLGWILESVVIATTASWAGLDISFGDAVLVTAVTIAAQIFAVAPGGFGTYEAAGTAALVGLDAPAGAALAAILTAHGFKTLYSLATGAVALFIPSPGAFGRLRLDRRAPVSVQVGTPHDPRPRPIVLFMPAFNEEDSIGRVLDRVPDEVLGHQVETLVIDDGSTDRTSEIARSRGVRVEHMGTNRGLGAAVRRGLEVATEMDPAAVAFCDADGEYAPEELDRLVGPVLAGEADYVIGSRFRGDIQRMLPHRRFGNYVLTRFLSVVARRRISDGQSGYRAFSPRAAGSAEVIHDYNYAQVLTLDLLGKGFRYLEVPITYSFRESGASFIKLGRYLRHVLPAVHREVNAERGRPA